jgi:hypothetical protein
MSKSEMYHLFRLARRSLGMTPAEALAWVRWDPFE